MKFEDLTPEQQQKAKACANTNELLELASEEGVTLSDEDLEKMSGGKNWAESFADGMN